MGSPKHLEGATLPGHEPSTTRVRIALAPRPRPSDIPLSLMQQRLWLLNQLDPESVAYNNIFATRLLGPLEPTVMVATLQLLSNRHEILRTRYHAVQEGDPRQVIEEPGPIRVRLEDFTDRPEGIREELAARAVAEEQLRPHDLSVAPPVRYLLVRLSSAHHVLAMAMHHVMCDAGSFAVIRREIDQVYPLLAAGRPLHLEPLPLQYADHALWQNECALAGRFDRQLTYWRDRLRDAPPAVDLSGIPPAPPGLSERSLGNSREFVLDRALTAGVLRLGREAHATPFMVLLSVYAVFIAQLGTAGLQDDVVIGIPFDGRHDRRLSQLIGMFINTLPIRVRHDRGHSFRRLLSQVRDTLLEAYGNADVPFDWLVRELMPERRPDRNPVFQVMLQLQHVESDAANVAGMELVPFPVARQPAKFDLTLSAVIADGAITCDLNYAAGLFADDGIVQLCEHFRTLAASAVSDPDRCVADLPRAPVCQEARMDTQVGDAPSAPRASSDPEPGTATESLLAHIFADVLGVPRVGVNDNFFDLGGHSLIAIRLMRRVNKELPTKLPTNAIFLHPTAASLAAAATGRQVDEGSTDDFLRDAVLDADLVQGVDPWQWTGDPPRDILLTGATGLLGRYVLREALLHTDARIWCLVRAPDEAAAMERLLSTMDRHALWDERWRNRVVAVCGDLAEPLLGMAPSTHQRLAQEIDAIFHVAANVNLLDPYARVRSTNVLGTREVLRLAARCRLKPAHVVSSTSTVAGGPDDPDVLPEDWTTDTRHLGTNGYLRSKWVAEELVRQARRSGVPTAIYRPSRICGDSTTGAMTETDAFWHYVKVCVELGAAPSGDGWHDQRVNLVPVDFAAAAFVRIALTRPPDGNAYSLTNHTPTALSTVLRHARRMGYPMREISFPEWQELLNAAAARDTAHWNTSVHSVALLNSIAGTAAGEVGGKQVSRATTELALAGTGIECPAVDPTVLSRYFDYFARSGFLAPAAQARDSVTDPAASKIAPVSPQRGFLERFADIVRRTPHAIAVKDGEHAVTFAALDKAAREVAAALQARGIGPGQRVAVRVEHSAALLEVIIGVLRAGVAVVPIDHRQLDRRAERMCAAAKVSLTVADRAAVERLRDEGARCGLAAVEDLPDPRPDDTAYVLFTSGSTGEPKGVVVSHGALAWYLDWAVTSYLRFAGDGAPLYTSIAFDLTITSLFAPLLAGRPVHMVAAEDGIGGVAKLLAAGARFDFLKLTPSHLRMLVAIVESTHIDSWIGCLVVGGEALPADLVREWRELSPSTVIVNEYGPTEATVGCCVYELGVGQPVPDEVPIGWAIPSVLLYVLDEHGAATPSGAVGELFIGGQTVADGYLGGAALTAERFVANPFVARPAARMYRTGDLVRLRPDGALCCLGRSDDQVKIRGYRVEPGEVEVAVRRLPAVRDCVIRPWVRDTDDTRLVAYVVADPAARETITASALRDLLIGQLPEYMVPGHVVEIEAIPLARNGKVDHTRLPDPSARLSVAG